MVRSVVCVMNRPFNLEEAKAGQQIITRDGRPAKFVASDDEIYHARFWSKVDAVTTKMQCWNWTGALNETCMFGGR